MKQTLTAEQLAAVQVWAMSHGRTWKAQLRQSWMTGNYDGFEQSNFLQQIRNTFGPSWLLGFRLPPVAVKPVYQMAISELEALKAQYTGRTDNVSQLMLLAINEALEVRTVPTVTGPHFDYVNQAWTVDGRYVACAHPDAPACKCYGNQHAGELAPIENLPTATENKEHAYTTFEDERAVYVHPNGEALVTATINGKRQYVAATKDGYRTDYPIDYGTGQIGWDNPEWFTEGFKSKARAAILAKKGI